ncbi:hypothetical protein K445DRAFT_364366 [Daldinia sp. EC12]|nr:hypothetical protein K445DRAFT_364366 [Daldinia sp. EC12]
MDNTSGPRGNNPPRGSSWANIVKNQNQDNSNEMNQSTLGNGRMSFKPRGNNKKPNTLSGQRDYPMITPAHSSKSSVSTPFTFKGQYLQQMQVARQQVSQKPDLEPQGVVQARGVQDTASLNLELASMKAKTLTLEEDLSRRSSDLIQARAALASKDMQIEDLQNTVAMLKENIRSITVATQTGEDESAAKDELIAKLEYENAGLRDSIHTGIISISQVYGPGSDQAFIRMAANETGDSWSSLRDNKNGRRDHQNFGQAMDVQSPHCPPQALRQISDVPHALPVHPTVHTKKSELQKENGYSKQSHQPSNKGHRFDKDAQQIVAVPYQPTSHIVNSIKDVSRPINESQHTKANEPLKSAEQPVGEAKELLRDHSKPSEDTHTPNKNSPSVDSNHSTEVICDSVQDDNKSISDSKTLSNLDPSIVRVSSTSVAGNKANDLVHTATGEDSTSDAGTNHAVSDPTGSQHRVNESLSTVKVDGRYRSKGIQESVNIMDGAALSKGVSEHPKSIDSPADKRPIHVRTQVTFWREKSPELEESRTALSSDVSSPPSNSQDVAVIPTEEGGHSPENLEEKDGWVDVAVKNKTNKQIKSEAKNNSKKNPTPSENSKLAAEQKSAQKPTKPVAKEKGIPATLQRRRGKKHPSGTVIGSNSIFARAAKEQQSEDEVNIEELSIDTKKQKTIAAEALTSPLSWADEVEEEEARRNS